MDDRWADDPECHTTALEEACAKGNLVVLTKLKPSAQADDLASLLARSAIPSSKEIIHYLLGLGAQPNDKTNGGSSALDHCFWRLGFGTYDQIVNKKLATKYEVTTTFECIRELVEHGAVWTPDDRNALNQVRQELYKCEPAVTVDFVKLLAANKACPEETLEQLLDAPRMKQHLSTLGMRLFGSSAASTRRGA